MRIEEVKVNSQGLGWDEALEFTEKLGLEGGLDKKELLQLRLLGEELIGLMRGIAGRNQRRGPDALPGRKRVKTVKFRGEKES